jgi:hypothetical protein
MNYRKESLKYIIVVDEIEAFKFNERLILSVVILGHGPAA